MFSTGLLIILSAVLFRLCLNLTDQVKSLKIQRAELEIKLDLEKARRLPEKDIDIVFNSEGGYTLVPKKQCDSQANANPTNL